MNDHEHWHVPLQPDPRSILLEAIDDLKSGRFAIANEKFVWFHRNADPRRALECDLRLTIAVWSWGHLMLSYDPARRSMIECRDAAELEFFELRFDRRYFCDAAALNLQLGDNDRTVALFREVVTQDMRSARSLYQHAEPFLVEAGVYGLCNPFLEPDKRLNFALLAIDISQELVKHCVGEISCLIGLLVQNGRRTEARRVYLRMLDVTNDRESVLTLNSAICGHLPKRICTEADLLANILAEQGGQKTGS